MSQKQKIAPARLAPAVLINGDTRAGEERLIGSDTGLAAVMARARIVSRSAAPVCCSVRPAPARRSSRARSTSTRRSGTARSAASTVARFLPSSSTRNCSATSRAPSPARSARRKGWFEQADGGTLFLDEVGELALAAQVRLLRVVQDCELVRVGGERPVKVNVRIVAATHRHLPSMVEQQTFREDLYYRLSVFPIVIPPLRDRPSDIRAFAEYFAELAANRFGLRPVPVSDSDVRVAGRVSVAGQRARDGRGDGPRGVDRSGESAQRCGRTRSGPEGIGPRSGAIERDGAVSHCAARRRHSTAHRGCARGDRRPGRGTRMAQRACSRSTRIRCGRACGS